MNLSSDILPVCNLYTMRALQKTKYCSNESVYNALLIYDIYNIDIIEDFLFFLKNKLSIIYDILLVNGIY